MSPRILFACWPFEGHVFPQLSIAIAAREQGCEVAFYTGQRLRPLVEAEGIEVFPFGRIEGAWEQVHARERTGGGRRQALRVQREAFRNWLVESIPGQVGDLQTIMEDWRPDVIVADSAFWGPSLILHERDELPVAIAAPLIYAPFRGPDAPPPGLRTGPSRTARSRTLARGITALTDVLTLGVRRRLDALRAEHGLGPMGAPVTSFLGRMPLYLVASVPGLDLRRRDLPPSVRYVGPLLWHPPEPEGTAAWLEGVPTRRSWVHVTEGTSHYEDPFLLRAAATGLAGAPLEAILTTGHHRRPDDLRLGSPAANVHVTQWLSHDALVPRCAALVTTGGPGTVMAALRAGVPLVVAPTTWDKPDNAHRVVEAGVGIKLSQRECTPERLCATVEEVLGDPRYRHNAAAIADELAAAPGPAGAARLIAGLVAAGDPTRGRFTIERSRA